MKRFIAILFLVLGLSLAYVLLGPVRTIYGIQSCIRQGEAERLDHYINFPSVRADLKAQIRDRVQAENTLSFEEPMGFLFSQLSTQFTDQIVDGFLNPETIASLINEAVPENTNNMNKDSEGTWNREFFESSEKVQAVLNGFKFRYLSIDTFEVVIENAHSEFNQARVLFERKGIDWWITQLALPEGFTFN